MKLSKKTKNTLLRIMLVVSLPVYFLIALIPTIVAGIPDVYDEVTRIDCDDVLWGRIISIFLVALSTYIGLVAVL